MTDRGIELSDLSAEGILALRKCDAAERFATVPGRVRPSVYLAFQECGLVEWRNGQRLTTDGRRLLDQWRAVRVDSRRGSPRLTSASTSSVEDHQPASKTINHSPGERCPNAEA